MRALTRRRMLGLTSGFMLAGVPARQVWTQTLALAGERAPQRPTPRPRLSPHAPGWARSQGVGLCQLQESSYVGMFCLQN